MTVELTLLSGLRFRDAEITGSRLPGLLALLADDLRTGCGVDRLVAGLWPEQRPEHPAKAVQVLVSRARARLGADVIESTATGYRLALTEHQVDAAAVVVHATTAERCAAAGKHSAVLDHADAGLALCGGAEAWDTEADDPVSALRAARFATYRSLVRARALALARLGRHPEAVAALRDLVAADPRDEEVLAELLRAEAAVASPAAALARYEDYRRTVLEELGTEPGIALQAVHQDLLAHDTPLVRHGVRHEPNPLLGRDKDLAAVTELLRTSRVTSIVGPGGLGKTRLAHAVGRAAPQRVVRFVELAALTADADPTTVAAEVAAALGVTEGAGLGVRAAPASVPGLIVAELGPALLVLDNCEHVVGGVAELVHALVSLGPDLRVLTTSRAPLDLSSESVYLLPELDLPTMIDLFQRRARAARSDVDLPAVAVRELCEHLDGLPLAVELAAARVRVSSVAEITRRLDDRFTLLRGGSRDAPQRHQTLHAVIDWSWHLLTPAGQAAMRALSIFPGGFTANAAAEVLGDDTELRQLVEQSLLKVSDTGSGTRFRMLETVREFSAARLAEAGETTAVIDRFLRWATRFGVRHHESLLTGDLVSTTHGIQVEQDNLVLAHRHAVDRDDGAAVAATVAVLGSLWVSESNILRLLAVATESSWALSHLRPAPELVETARTAGVLCAHMGYLAGPRGALRALVALRRLPAAPPDNPIRAAQLALCAPDLPSLLELGTSPEPMLAGMANYLASYVWETADRLDRALAAARRMLVEFERDGVLMLRALAHARVGELCLDQDPGESAFRHLHTALLLTEELGWWRSAVQARWALVLAHLQRGAFDDAEVLLDQVLREHGQPSTGPATFETIARAAILLGRGEVAAGLELWREAARHLRDHRATATERWPWQVQAVAVLAHARHGRLDLVPDLVEALPAGMTTMVNVVSTVDSRLYGPVLLAIAEIDLARGAVASGVRLTALAQRFGVLQVFNPTVSVDHARVAAERADPVAYADAVTAYAGLDRDDLRAAARAAMRARDDLR